MINLISVVIQPSIDHPDVIIEFILKLISEYLAFRHKTPRQNHLFTVWIQSLEFVHISYIYFNQI